MNTVSVKVREGAYKAMKEVAEITGMDISSIASMCFMMGLQSMNLGERLSQETKMALARDSFNMMGDFVKFLGACVTEENVDVEDFVKIFTG